MLKCRWLRAVLPTLATLCLAGPITISTSAAVLSIGHRGNSLFAPENTLAAFEACQGLADLVELDGHVTSDGVIVVLHDSTVDRTTEGSGAVSGKTLAQIKALDAGSWFSPEFTGQKIPTLEEAITNILGYATPLIERKAGSAALYVDELRRLGAVSKVVVQAFDWPFLAAVRALEPDIRLGALGSGTLTATTLTNIINSGANMVAWEKSSVTPSMLNLVRSAGLQMYVWTVDGAGVQTFIDMGVDGIISNDPGLVKRLQDTTPDSTTDLGAGLVAHWRMDDGLTHLFNVIVGDSAGTNHATLSRTDGKSHWDTGAMAKFDGCVHVDGTNASVSVANTGALDINTNGLTLSTWVRLERLPSQLGTAYGAIYDSTTDCYVFYLDRSNKELRFKVTDAAGHAARPGIPEAALVTNQWIHIVGTYAGQVGPASGQATIYLNGQPRDVHTGNDNTSPVGLTGNVKPGQHAGIGREGAAGGSYFTGYVDDFAIWNRALNPAEVQKLYQEGQLGSGLADLLRKPSALLQIVNVGLGSKPGELIILFQNEGPWQSFRLLHTAALGEPFEPMENVFPTALGGGLYQFTCELPDEAPAGLFQIDGR